MGRKANHNHNKGADGKRSCSNPCMHRRKGTSRRACRRKTRMDNDAKSERDLNKRLKSWAVNKRLDKLM